MCQALNLVKHLIIIVFMASCHPNFAEIGQKHEVERWSTLRYALFHNIGEKISVRSPRTNEEFKLVEAIHMGLLIDEDLPRGGAAKSWSIEQDGRLISFQIDEELKFHDGTRLKCEDAKRSIEEIRKHPRLKRSFSVIREVKCRDSILLVTLSESRYGFLSLLATPTAAILPASGNDSGMVGLGPYRVESRNPFSLAVASQNHPAILDWSPEKVEVIQYRNVEEAIVDFNSGKLDVIDLYQFPEASRNAVVSKSHNRIWFAFAGRFSDQAVDLLRCLNNVMDRESLASIIDGHIPAFGLYPPSSQGFFQGSRQRPTDCEQFSGKHLSIVALTKGRFESLPPKIQEQASLQDLDLSVHQVSIEEFLSHLQKRDFDIGVASFGISSSPNEYLGWLFGRLFSEPNPEIIEKLESLEQARTPGEAWNTVYSLSRHNWDHPSIVPLLFQPAAFKIAPCVSLQRTGVTVLAAFNKVARIRNCSQ